MSFVLHFDGAARRAVQCKFKSGCGAAIYREDGKIFEMHWKHLPDGTTSNEAEYEGLLLGLRRCKKLKLSNLIIKGDSALVINQVFGAWKVKAAGLKSYVQQAKDLSKKFGTIEAVWIPRAENKEADKLANKAIDEKTSGSQVISDLSARKKDASESHLDYTALHPAKKLKANASETRETMKRKLSTKQEVYTFFDPLIFDAEVHLAVLRAEREHALSTFGSEDKQPHFHSSNLSRSS